MSVVLTKLHLNGEELNLFVCLLGGDMQEAPVCQSLLFPFL